MKIMHLILIFFAILGFFVVARQIASFLLFALRHLVAIFPRMLSGCFYVLGRLFHGLFQLLSNLVWAARKLLIVARRTIALIATGVEKMIGAIREPGYVRDQTQEIAQERKRPVRILAVSEMARFWIVPTTVLAIFLYLSGRLQPELQRLADMVRPRSSSNQTNSAGTATPPDNWNPVVTVDYSLAPHSTEEPRLRYSQTPAWIADGDSTKGDVTKIVLTSQLWSTVDEARKELQAKAAAFVDQDFLRRHHNFLDPRIGRFVSQERLAQVAVKDQHVEQVQLDFGTMNRLWWLVEISPMVRTELYSNWKAAKVQNRVIALGAGIAFLTLFASASALFVKLKSVSHYGTVRALATTGGCSAIWIGAVAFVTNRMLC